MKEKQERDAANNKAELEKLSSQVSVRTMLNDKVYYHRVDF